MLYRIAQTGTLRLLINAPQVNASEIRVGQNAQITFNELPGKTFEGKVARSSGSLDPATRTLLVEVQVGNAKGELLPGMYAQIHFAIPRSTPIVTIPANALVADGQGTRAAVVDANGRVHFRKVDVGRDLGTSVEVLSGVAAGEAVASNPPDTLKDGQQVSAKLLPENNQ